MPSSNTKPKTYFYSQSHKIVYNTQEMSLNLSFKLYKHIHTPSHVRFWNVFPNLLQHNSILLY